jgi:hypothetical protein
MGERRICAVEGCSEIEYMVLGFCRAHYQLPFPERFWAQVDQTSDGCWPWKRRRNHKGYGMVLFEGKTRQAPRVAFILATGSEPVGLIVRHTCDNPPADPIT